VLVQIPALTPHGRIEEVQNSAASQADASQGLLKRGVSGQKVMRSDGRMLEGHDPETWVRHVKTLELTSPFPPG
jgi:hypothetical protein